MTTVDASTALTWCSEGAGDLEATAAGRAERFAEVTTTDVDADHLIRLVDLTSLEGSDTPATIAALCEQARCPDPTDLDGPAVAAVCVYPSLVPTAVQHTAGSPVLVASVAGAFPSGLSPLPVRLADIEAAIAAGADEVDIVLNRSAFLSDDHTTAHHELVASIEAARGRTVKVILEVGELEGPVSVYTAAMLAMAAGADFVKTSTGKITRSASPEAVSYLVDAIERFQAETGRQVGLKISGGVRTLDQAVAYHDLVVDALGEQWSSPRLLRFGASGLLGALVEAR